MIRKRWLLFIFFLSSGMAFPQNPVQDIFFEITRQTVAGASSLPIAQNLAGISVQAAEFWTRPVWRLGQENPLYLIELYYPEKTNVIDLTYASVNAGQVAETKTDDEIPEWVDPDGLAEKFTAEEGEEPVDVAEQMLESMDNRDEGGIVEGQDDDSSEPKEASFTDKDGRLRRFSFGDEHFSVREKDGIKTMTDSADGLVVRRTIDTNNRLLKQERFKIGSSSRSLTLVSAREYAYHDGEKLPYRLVEEQVEAKKRVVTEYDENGLSVLLETAHYVYPDKNDKKHKDDPPKLVRDRKKMWTYDGEKRLTAEEAITYLYSKTATGKEKIEEEVIKKEFRYGGAGKSPDSSYYENGELRIRTVYESENVYNETMYFDGGFTVLTRYENGIKRMEIISIDGTEIRRRTFEN